MQSWQDPNREKKEYGDKQVSYAEYKVNKTRVMVGSRPDCFGWDFQHSDKVSAFLSVTDRLIDYPLNYTVRWFPWDETYDLNCKILFPSLVTLHRWIIDHEVESVYIHCDAGTHRAPTTFGMFLLTYFPDEAGKIVEGHKLIRRNVLSDPIEYAKRYLEENENLQKFVDYMKTYDFSKDANHDFLDNILEYTIGIKNDFYKRKGIYDELRGEDD